MDIQQFIEETIKQIVDATNTSSKHIEKTFDKKDGISGSHSHLTEVAFDLSVTAVENINGEAASELKIVPFVKLKAGVGSNNESQTYSRVQFKLLVNVTGRNHPIEDIDPDDYWGKVE